MKKYYLILLLIVPLFAKSQDLIVLNNGNKLHCKITGTDSVNVYYLFTRNNTQLQSFINKTDVLSFEINAFTDTVKSSVDTITKTNNDLNIDTIEKIDKIDTIVKIHEVVKKVHIITFSKKYGTSALGWSVQYFRYVLNNNSKWIVPFMFGIEGFEIDADYFKQFNYQSVKMSYGMLGISPFRKLNNYFYANVGLQLIIGSEQLVDNSRAQKDNVFFGIAPMQGIYFIPKSDIGLVIGVGLYQKFLSSEVYKEDFGFKIEMGLKF